MIVKFSRDIEKNYRERIERLLNYVVGDRKLSNLRFNFSLSYNPKITAGGKCIFFKVLGGTKEACTYPEKQRCPKPVINLELSPRCTDEQIIHAVAHELKHYLDRIAQGRTSERSANKFANEMVEKYKREHETLGKS